MTHVFAWAHSLIKVVELSFEFDYRKSVHIMISIMAKKTHTVKSDVFAKIHLPLLSSAVNFGLTILF